MPADLRPLVPADLHLIDAFLCACGVAGAMATRLGRWGQEARAAASLPPDSRPPLPHITLVRRRRLDQPEFGAVRPSVRG